MESRRGKFAPAFGNKTEVTLAELMHHRFPLVLLVSLFMIAGISRVGAQSSAPLTSIQPNEVWATGIVGDVTAELGSSRRQLKGQQKVEEGSTIRTGLGASVILVFSNRARTQLGENSVLELRKYQHDIAEPSAKGNETDVEDGKSVTELRLALGELSGTVKLRKDGKSNFEVGTPVGAAGIRGTTFRIIYRPPAAGQAFGTPGTFQLINNDGGVIFNSGAQGGGAGAGGGGGGAPGPGGSVGAVGTTQGLEIPAGQQIEITLVSSGGNIVAQAPVGSTTAGAPVPVPIPPALVQQITELSVALVTVVQQATFKTQAPAGGGTTGQSGTQGTGPGTGQGTQTGTGAQTVEATGGGASATGIVLPPVQAPSNPRVTGP